MMEALAPGGRCAVVVPEGLLFGSTNAHTELRKKLIEDFELLAVVSLPAGVFKPYAGVITAVLVFRRPVNSTRIEDRAVGFMKLITMAMIRIESLGEDVRKPRSVMTFPACSTIGRYTRIPSSQIHPV